MPSERQNRMAEDIGGRFETRRNSPYMSSARHHDSKYSQATLRAFGAELMPAVLRGEIGRTTVLGLAEQFERRPALVRAFLQQPDAKSSLSFVRETVVAGQACELAHELARHPDPYVVLVRTQPTCPLEGMHVTYKGKYAYGLADGRPSGAFDSVFATFISPAHNGHEQSVNLGGLVKALKRDREAWQAKEPMEYLSDLQRLSLEKPIAAMFMHAGAVYAAIRPEIPPGVDASLFIFLQGRFEGYEPSEWLASPSDTVSIVSESGYQTAARAALGDSVDLVVEAEGSNPHDQGLERRHVYVMPDGRVFDNETVRRLVAAGHPYRLDPRWIEAEHRGLGIYLLDGELRAPTPDGLYDAGQTLLRIAADDELRLFSLLNRSDGARAWTGTRAEKRKKLTRLAEAFAMLEAGDSTAGYTRRQQFEALQLFDVPMSLPSGRETVWTLASAARQAGFPDMPLGALLLPKR